MDLPEQGEVEGYSMGHVHSIGPWSKSHDPVGPDFRECPARILRKLHQKVVLAVVEDVVSPRMWDARHLFVKRRLDLDLGWEL